jgi:hypothetical protein
MEELQGRKCIQAKGTVEILREDIEVNGFLLSFSTE